MLCHPDVRGDTTMVAAKKREYERDIALYRKPTRDIPPADYSDEVSDEQLEAARKLIGNEFEGWQVVDGPAW